MALALPRGLELANRAYKEGMRESMKLIEIVAEEVLMHEGTELDCPADLPADVAERLQEMARRAFTALDCSGLARVDFFVGADGELTLNEVNTMPGFTPSSMFPRMWAATGVDYPALVDRLVQTALRRGTGLR